ncbi:hypothetical protein [Streptomyces sp. SA15]|uniref:hypothetical protein n=1 Tax=Streptomyces sp. SA15 TaxID=934019 RepID=UPI0015C7B21C|nr:hypothetical protein [Streptomyces sp. SA15]
MGGLLTRSWVRRRFDGDPEHNERVNKVTDEASGAPVGGVAVSISGHASGFPGADFSAVTATDGTTWTTAAEGHFGPADTGRENAVPLKAGTGENVRYVRLVMLGNQAVDNGVDCAKNPGPSGCEYLDATELVVHGTPRQG